MNNLIVNKQWKIYGLTDIVEKADSLNNQFQSVFTNETDTYIPEKGLSLHTKIPQISISSAGVSTLLCNLNPHKACRPDLNQYLTGNIMVYGKHQR
jgi:hypothetical protein